MEIKLYESWMQPQVTKLFSVQYGTSEEVVAKTHAQFYEHSFQKDKCIRLVALDGEKVIGFQSLFYWPYKKNGKIYNTFQSGNSIVHPEYRGKGIFQKLLHYLDEYNQDLQLDFLMGFPVQASYGSFMKCKWSNPLNIVWHVKIINPFGFLFSLNKVPGHFDQTPKQITQETTADTFRLAKDHAFDEWMSSFREAGNYCFFNFSENGHSISFHLKTSKRNKWFNELIIGDVRSSTLDLAFIKKGMRKLSRRAFTSKGITALTIAINEASSSPVNEVVKQMNFIQTKKSIYFITKSYKEQLDIENPATWELYRSDIDTW